MESAKGASNFDFWVEAISFEIRSKFPYRIFQKRQYRLNCLIFYFNSFIFIGIDEVFRAEAKDSCTVLYDRCYVCMYMEERKEYEVILSNTLLCLSQSNLVT